MASDVSDVWRKCFENWPADIDRRGVVVTSFNEQIQFEGFSTNSDLLLVERRTPDTVGARLVLIPYQNIEAVKITDVVKMKSFQPMGFTSPPPR